MNLNDLETKRIAGSIWVISIQYFIVQLLVGTAWHGRFSLRSNTISDLGNTVCGPYGHRYVCSPLHAYMNVSFVLLGVGMVIGSLIFYRSAVVWQLKTGWLGLAVAGAGTCLVGLFPENSVAIIHVIGAAAPFLIGNGSLVLLGLYLRTSKGFRVYTLLSGLIPLLALTLFLSGNYFLLKTGGMERLVAYPQTIWLIVYGLKTINERRSTKVTAN